MDEASGAIAHVSYPSKVEVNNINTARLAALTTPLQQYISSDVAGTNSKGYRLTQGEATDVLNRNTIWVEELHVKTGAMVMLVTVSFKTDTTALAHQTEHAGAVAASLLGSPGSADE